MSDSDSPFSQIIHSIFSDNSNIMLAAIISLLLVILFVLLLHLYAKWFLAHSQSRRLRHRRRAVTVSDVLGPSRLHHFHTFNLHHDSPLSTKGLDSAALAAIPVFIYQESDDYNNDAGDGGEDDDVRDLECVICLSAFGDGQIGRSLPKCGHAFHMDCIDMWFASHSNCPICRAPIHTTTAIVVVDVENRDSDNNANSDQLDSVVTGDNDSSDALLEIVIDSPNSDVSIINESNHQILHESSGNNVSNSTINSENNSERVSDDSETSSSLLLGSSLKRMLGKVFPSSNDNVHDTLNQ